MNTKTRMSTWKLLMKTEEKGRCGQTKTYLERQEHQSPVKSEATLCANPVHLSLRTRVVDIDSRTAEKDPSSGNEVFQKTPRRHIVYRPHHKRRSSENHLKTCEGLRRHPDDSEEVEVEVV